MEFEAVELGSDEGKGNLLGVQPSMGVSDYASESAFHKGIERYLGAARERCWLSTRTVVVFPEHIGTWLAACGATEQVFGAGTIAAATRALCLRNPLGFAWSLLASAEQDRATAALFRMQGAEMAPRAMSSHH